MKLSARNQMSGTVVSVEKGSVNGIVTLDAGGIEIKGTISLGSIAELGLESGTKATAIVKATEVMIGVGDFKISAKNQISGKVTAIEKGSVNGIVTIKNEAVEVSATISLSSIEALGLEIGSEAVAIIKATSVMFGV